MLVCGLAAALCLTAATAEANTAKKPPPGPTYDSPTVGVLGAHRGGASTDAPMPRRPPSAPVAAPALPKVDVEAPTVGSSPTAPMPLPAAPRPEAHVEGAPAGAPAAAPPAVEPPRPDGFLANHRVISGLVAGLIGTGLGSILYGGPMMGDETAALVGYLGRVAFIILMAVLMVRTIWRLIDRPGEEDLVPPPRRKEPSFDRPAAAGDGRREPSLSWGAAKRQDDRPRR